MALYRIHKGLSTDIPLFLENEIDFVKHCLIRFVSFRLYQRQKLVQ